MDEQWDDYDMSHYAQVEHGVVMRLMVVEAEVLATGLWGEGWIETFYAAHSGESVPLRKNYAGIGYTYDVVRDAFIPPQPYPSWILAEETCRWRPPVPKPTDNKLYRWDEATVAWIGRVPSATELGAQAAMKSNYQADQVMPPV